MQVSADEGELEHSKVVGRELLVLRAELVVAPEPADAAFDDVTAHVDLWVEDPATLVCDPGLGGRARVVLCPPYGRAARYDQAPAQQHAQRLPWATAANTQHISARSSTVTTTTSTRS